MGGSFELHYEFPIKNIKSIFTYKPYEWKRNDFCLLIFCSTVVGLYRFASIYFLWTHKWQVTLPETEKQNIEVVINRCSAESLFWNFQKNTSDGVFFSKVSGCCPVILIKNGSDTNVFRRFLPDFLFELIFQSNSRWLILNSKMSCDLDLWTCVTSSEWPF